MAFLIDFLVAVWRKVFNFLSSPERGVQHSLPCNRTGNTQGLYTCRLILHRIMFYCLLSYSSCLTIKVISVQLRHFLNPHYDFGSTFPASFCKQFRTILPNSLPTTSSREIPLQLSQQCRFPFLGTGASHQS